MQYGICNLNAVPVRKEKSDRSEMVSQVLFGDHFEILNRQKDWIRIRIAFDQYEGWIGDKQYLEISESQFLAYDKTPDLFLTDLVDFAIDGDNQSLTPLSLGANLKLGKFIHWSCDGQLSGKTLSKRALVNLALNYLNAPYLWGGKTPFGIDCSGLTQMVYKISGYPLPRDASEQVQLGENLSFIEECEPGDLAFFDNEEGEIIHVGILLKDNYIIHSSGKVRIDRIDQTGIFNVDTHRHSHRLRVLKRVI